MNNNGEFVKIILAILLFLCLLDFPYGHYVLVRFVGCFGFVYLSYCAYEKKQNTDMVVFGIFALLFQPFFKIAFGRVVWNVVDVVVAIYLIISYFRQNRISK